MDAKTPPALIGGPSEQERIEAVVRDMLGQQAIRIAILTAQLERAHAELARRTQELTAVLAELEALRPSASPPKE